MRSRNGITLIKISRVMVRLPIVVGIPVRLILYEGIMVVTVVLHGRMLKRNGR